MMLQDVALLSHLCEPPWSWHTCVVYNFVGETDELQHMLEQLEPHAGHVQGWDNGGSIFLDYLRISNRFRQLSLSSSPHKPLSEYNLESLLEGLKLLSGRISLLPEDTPRKVYVGIYLAWMEHCLFFPSFEAIIYIFIV